MGAERFTALLGPKTAQQASFKVYARATYYPHFTRVYIPNNPYNKLQPGMEAKALHKKLTRVRPENESVEEDTERSLRRTKKTITDYILCNEFDLFATFTFKSKRQDIDGCKAKMSNWLKNQRKRKGKFKYLIVPEFHKDGSSLHFHALMKNYAGVVKEAINPKTGEKILDGGLQVYSIPSYRSGFTSVKKIGDSTGDHARVGGYIRKYITKGMPLFFGKNRYWASSGLRLPLTEDNPPKWYLERSPSRIYGSEHGVILDFSNDPSAESV